MTMADTPYGFNANDVHRIGRTVRTVERLPSQSLRGDQTVRRGMGTPVDTGTVQGQVKIMTSDHQSAWGFVFFVPMS
jgi:hypothetical protein